jgi:uncharacterized membrane protein YidH (DUF202 family)
MVAATGFPQTTGKTRHRMLGSYLIFLSPIVSIVLVLGPVRWAQEFLFNARGQQELEFLFYPAIVHSAANLAAIAILTVGLGLFAIHASQDKRINEIKDNRPIIFLSWLLVLWGIIVAFVGLLGYEHLLQWASDPYRRPLSAWEYLEYVTWMLKGSLWAVSGLFLVRAFGVRFSKYVHEILSHNNLPTEI